MSLKKTIRMRAKEGKVSRVHDILKLGRWHRTPPDMHFEEVLNETQVLDTTSQLLSSFLGASQCVQVVASSSNSPQRTRTLR